MTESSTYSLVAASERMALLSEHPFERRFKFIVGGNEYACHISQAAFISNRVIELLTADPTTDTMYIDVDDTEKQFAQIVTLMNGGTIEVPHAIDKQEYMLMMADVLKNPELKKAILEHVVGTDEITLENAVERLILKTEGDLDREKELDFVANNLFSVKFESKYKNILDALGIDLSREVLTRGCVVIPDEDALLDIILQVKFLSLVEFVESQYLSTSGVQKFLRNVGLCDMNNQIWNSICRRMICQLYKPPTRRNVHTISVPFHTKAWPEENRFSEGISGLLRRKARESGKQSEHLQNVIVQTKGPTVEKTGTRRNYNQSEIINLTGNEWFLLDFGELTVCPSHYW